VQCCFRCRLQPDLDEGLLEYRVLEPEASDFMVHNRTMLAFQATVHSAKTNLTIKKMRMRRMRMRMRMRRRRRRRRRTKTRQTRTRRYRPLVDLTDYGAALHLASITTSNLLSSDSRFPSKLDSEGCERLYLNVSSGIRASTLSYFYSDQ